MIPSLVLLSASMVSTPVFISEVKAARRRVICAWKCGATVASIPKWRAP